MSQRFDWQPSGSRELDGRGAEPPPRLSPASDGPAPSADDRTQSTTEPAPDTRPTPAVPADARPFEPDPDTRPTPAVPADARPFEPDPDTRPTPAVPADARPFEPDPDTRPTPVDPADAITQPILVVPVARTRAEDQAEPTAPPAERAPVRPNGRRWSLAGVTVLGCRVVLAGLACWACGLFLFLDPALLTRLAVLAAAGVLVVTGWSVVSTLGGWSGPPGALKLTVVTSEVLVAIVAAVMLAPPSPDQRLWAQVAHVVLPAGIVVDFVFFDPHRRLRSRACWLALALPVLYFAALGVAGVVGEVPYEIFKVRVIGWPSVLANVATCLAVATSACAAVLATDSLLPTRPLVGVQGRLR